MGGSAGPAGVNVKPPATVGSGFHPWSNAVRICFCPTRKKNGRFFNYTSLFLSLFRVFFAPLSACIAQEGIWPSAAKAWFTPPQKAAYSLVVNIYVTALFPEHCTLQMNSNCLARYQYIKLKRSKAHSPTAALKRCRPHRAVCPRREWPALSLALGTVCFRPPKPCLPNRVPIVLSLWWGTGSSWQRAGTGSCCAFAVSHHPHPKSFLLYAYSGCTYLHSFSLKPSPHVPSQTALLKTLSPSFFLIGPLWVLEGHNKITPAPYFLWAEGSLNIPLHPFGFYQVTPLLCQLSSQAQWAAGQTAMPPE